MKYIPSFILPLIVVLNFGISYSQNEKPIIANLSFNNDLSTKTITIFFDLLDQEDENIEITFKASYDFGNKFLVNTSNATGDVGYPVNVGNQKSITWYYGDIWNNIEGKTLRVIADDLYEIDINELVAKVDSNRIKSMLNFISKPRSFDYAPEHLLVVRDTLEALLTSYNYDVKKQKFDYEGNQATNIIGYKQGLKDERRTIVMDAHYDAYFNAVGADDNGSGVVGFMEAARVLSEYNFDKSIEFIGFDQEENYLLGSINYVFFGGIEPWKIIEGALNFEMIGYYSEEPYSQEFPEGFDLLFPEQQQQLIEDEFRGNFIFLAGNDASIHLVNAFHEAAENYVPELKVISGIVPLNGLIAPDLLRSDHAPFWFSGKPALMITDGAEFRNYHYHTPNDVVANLDFNFLTNVTKACMATMIEMAGINHATTKTFVVEDQIITSINQNENCEVLLYPNPTVEKLNIQLTSCINSNHKIIAKIYDVSGHLVAQKQFSNSNAQISVVDFSCGTYLLELNDGNTSFTYSFVVQ